MVNRSGESMKTSLYTKSPENSQINGLFFIIGHIYESSNGCFFHWYMLVYQSVFVKSACFGARDRTNGGCDFSVQVFAFCFWCLCVCVSFHSIGLRFLENGILDARMWQFWMPNFDQTFGSCLAALHKYWTINYEYVILVYTPKILTSPLKRDHFPMEDYILFKGHLSIYIYIYVRI